ncbi:GNAT family N-acetyltransferase [Antrihabitans sp. YC2-6]|nr:GNAT family N-acetyltransferase [Antrihabitans sp. YC2-6]MBJ8343218.1 GNAT family N-acetyltransferase [Antrihabitans sp. YC2-6]
MPQNGQHNAAHAPTVVELSAQDLRRRLNEALSIYVAAMDYPRGTEHHRAPMWAEHISRPGWRAVGAFLNDPLTFPDSRDNPLVAIGYGYRGAPHQWWHQQVYSGMRSAGWPEEATHETLSNYFELTELHVHPGAQGHRLGETILRRLMHDRPERSILLSTPEVYGEDNRAWRLYRRLGFRDVVRQFTFTGDSRPFAVLGRSLPLPSTVRAPAS